MLNLMKTLTATCGISGREKAISDKLLTIVAPITDKCYNDPMGNLIAVKYGTAPEADRKKIMLCAHMDEIGFLVTYIEDSGFIRVQPIGGINWVAAAFTEVVFGNGLKGILVPEAGTSPADLSADKCYIDIGAKDRADALKYVELGDTVQEMVITKDRAFTFSIDKGNATQQFNIKQANQALKRQIDEVVTPEIDIFRFGKWVAGAGKENADGALTKSNALEKIFCGSTAMNNLLVPKNNRTLFIKESVFFNVKLADQILNSEKLGNAALANGSVGKLDNMNVVPVPDSYFPDGVNFIIKYKGSTVDPIQLKTYRILKEVQGVDGDVVEGRIIYASFVLETRKNGIYVSTTA